MMFNKWTFAVVVLLMCCSPCLAAQGGDPLSDQTIFDDQLLLDGYAEKYAENSKDILLAIIQDETISTYKTASAVRVFREKFSGEIFSREKLLVEKILLRKLHRAESAFVQVEIMHTLCLMDRYKYFASMIPSLILKLDHYNDTVNLMVYFALNEIIEIGHNRPREARIVFNNLRRILFLSRKRLAEVEEPNERLKQKLELVRWSVKVLGTQEIRRLPKEVINLL